MRKAGLDLESVTSQENKQPRVVTCANTTQHNTPLRSFLFLSSSSSFFPFLPSSAFPWPHLFDRSQDISHLYIYIYKFIYLRIHMYNFFRLCSLLFFQRSVIQRKIKNKKIPKESALPFLGVCSHLKRPSETCSTKWNRFVSDVFLFLLFFSGGRQEKTIYTFSS